MEQDAIDAEVVALKQLGKSGPEHQALIETVMRQKPTRWASKVPQVFLARLAERHMSASVCTQAMAVLAEFDSTAAQDAGAAA